MSDTPAAPPPKQTPTSYLSLSSVRSPGALRLAALLGALLALLWATGCSRPVPDTELATTLDPLSTAPVGSIYTVHWESDSFESIYTDIETLSLVRVTRSLSDDPAEPRYEFIDQVGLTPSQNLGAHAFLRMPELELCWYVDARTDPAASVKLIRRRSEEELWRIRLPSTRGTPIYALADEATALLFTWDAGLWFQPTAFDGEPTDVPRILLEQSPSSPSPPPVPMPVAGMNAFSVTVSPGTGVVVIGVEDGSPTLRHIREAGEIHSVAWEQGHIQTLTYDPSAQEMLHITGEGRSASILPLTRSRDTATVSLLFPGGDPCYIYDELTVVDDTPVHALSLLYTQHIDDGSTRLRKTLLHTSASPIASFRAHASGTEIRIVINQNGLWLLRVDIGVNSE